MKFLKGLLFCCLFTLAAHAQIADLAKLSNGKLYSSDVIKDGKNNIRGYFLLFESDKVAKETYELEYVLLDENLNKVTSGFITEMKYESWVMSSEGIEVNVSLYKDKLLLELTDNFAIPYTRYRTLDLKTNKISDPFIYYGDALNTKPVFNRKMTQIIENQSCPMFYLDGVGLMAYTDHPMRRKEFKKVAYVHYDENMNLLWEYVVEEKGKNGQPQKFAKCIASDEDVIAFESRVKEGDGWSHAVSLLLIDSEQGTPYEPVQFPSAEDTGYRIIECTLSNDKVYVLGTYYHVKGKNHKADYEGEGSGMFCLVFNKANGALEEQKHIPWASIAAPAPIDKKGHIEDQGQLYIHQMQRLDNGKIIVVTEAYEVTPETNNMYFFELEPDFAVGQVFEVKKFRNKFSGGKLGTDSMLHSGMFDFMGYQNLGDGEYLFFFSDNEKKSKNRNKATLYGIVHYANGKFERQSLNLKTENSIIEASSAKKGYLMLYETFDDKNKTPELRLEKINY
jgi:hypothetical protein